MLKRGGFLAALLAASACAPVRHAPTAPPPPPRNALEAGVVRADWPVWSAQDEARAAEAFRASCSAAQARTDRSGLTQTGDWQAPCQAALAGKLPKAELVPVRVGDGRAFVTGYYEPAVTGARAPGPGFATPLYRPPPELLPRPAGSGGPRFGTMVDGVLTPFHTRAAIDAGALAGRGLELVWLADPVEAFFLEIQGSGRVTFADGSAMRVGYAAQNGHPYVGIGKLLADRGMLLPHQRSAQGIKAYLRAQPDGGRAIMQENPSYVFFREVAAPTGAMGVAVTPRASVAVDPAFVPLGAPIVLTTDGQASGLWVAQDTGGAIRGANRFDSYWGDLPDAAQIAGGMSERGQAIILLPRAAAMRLGLAGDAQRR